MDDLARARERLAFALDVADLASARDWIARLRGEVGVFKIGLELFTSVGPAAIDLVHAAGARCFLDLKLHDIPETVGRAVGAACRHRVAMLTVHASGGRAMLERAAREAAADGGSLRVLAVTMLTSLGDESVVELGFGPSASEAAARLGSLAIEAGVAGLVCSAHEVRALRARAPRAFIVTPGIRPEGSEPGDQSRIATPAAAVRDGADLLVVGRPIRDASDPAAAARSIVDAIARAS